MHRLYCTVPGKRSERIFLSSLFPEVANGKALIISGYHGQRIEAGYQGEPKKTDQSQTKAVSQDLDVAPWAAALYPRLIYGRHLQMALEPDILSVPATLAANGEYSGGLTA